ncbi:MAG: hypothetical protein H0V84_07505 [Actinobacteria bacterium]|nr:hypothetical protein [Actinomycetota bacterium]
MSEAALPTTVACPDCGYDVPAAPYCVRCGEWLEDDLASHPTARRGFGAAPNESRFAPKLSTLFPQLPRNELDTFQLALGAGVAVVIALALGRLFPLALVAAAVLTPLLLILYLWEVDLYEDEPVHVIALTVAWGAVAGVAMGLLSKEIVDVDAGFVAERTGRTVVWLGIVLPLVGVILMLVGPLVLLPYRKFNDVLDGATFGAASAVAFVGAGLLTHSASYLGTGLRPVGDVVPWTVRVIALAVAIPVIAAGSVGGAAGSLWLKYRAPARDRNALGLLGNPAVAIPLAGALVVGAALIQLYTREWLQLALLVATSLLALLWLRHVIDVGLRQESAEIEIGPPVACANCGKATPRHTFCASCGVSLQALPKATRPGRLAPPPAGQEAF